MGRKRTRTGKHIYLRIASLIILSLWGCATIEKTKQRVEVGTPLSETKEQVEVGGIPLEKAKGEEEIIKKGGETKKRLPSLSCFLISPVQRSEPGYYLCLQ